MEERVARVDDLADGQMTVVTVEGKKTLLVRVGDAFYATAARCPHWGAPLEEGLLNGLRLLCPLHKSIFDPRDGGLVEPPALDGLRAFHVRVDGGDVYVDRGRDAAGVAAGEAAAQTGTDPRTVAIVGGGAAAAAAVETLRAERYAGRIVVVSREDRWPYDRPNLSKDFLTDRIEAKWLPLRPPAFYDGIRVERVVARVVELEVGTRTLTLEDGTSLTADAVLIASGARARHLNVPGAELDGVFTLRSWDDAERLVTAARAATRAVVVGASFIGMEVAAALRQRGLHVAVVAPEAAPFELALGAKVGEVVRSVHSQNGTSFAMGRGVKRFLGEEIVRGVELDDGTRLDADLIVVGVGAQPETEYIRGVELDDDGGVPVDERLRAAPGVWAAGDVACYREPHTGRRQRIEHWRLAEQHGRAAARAMMGRDDPFRGVPFFWTQHFDLRLGYAGAGRGWEGVVVAGDLAARDFTAFYHAGDELLAACGTQDDELAAFLELMEAGALPSVDVVRGRPRANLARLL